MTVDDAFDPFRRAFLADRTAHAYLLVGSPRGAAGDLAIRILQLLACQEENPPCKTCNACRQASERIWVDACWIEPEKRSRIISVDQIRDIVLPFASQTSFIGGWKAILLAGADCLNTEAANAFLLTLEEPPPRTLILLLTDTPEALPPTILSRCQRLDVREVEPPGILLDPDCREAILDAVTDAANEGPAAAMAVAARLNAILDGLKDRARAEIAAEARQEEDKLDEDDEVLDARIEARFREYRAAFLECILSWYRDLLVLRSGGDPSLVDNPSRLETLQARAARLTRSQALANVDGIEELARQFNRHLPPTTLLPYWFDRLYSGAR
ncbi:MAG: ATP-binding protein [Kiritimatiellia bacterium]|jgi:DNA polymerase-3 subunit delta'